MKNTLRNLALALSMGAVVAACSTPKPEKTIENLKAAITGESNASAKYSEFSKKAAAEGFQNISKLFAAASEAEAIHVKNHQAVLAKYGETFTATINEIKVDSTLANLQAAIDGEVYESTQMYPGFLETSQLEKSTEATTSFNWAKDAETKHAKMYTEALNILKTAGNDATVSAEWYVCPKCGDLYKSITDLKNCELCGTASDKFLKF